MNKQIYAYILDNGEIKNSYISTENLPNDYMRYTNEEGDIYLYKDYSRTNAPLTMTTKERWESMIKVQEIQTPNETVIKEDWKSSKESDINKFKTMKLGFFHIVYTYIFMPLMLLSAILTFVGEIYGAMIEHIFHIDMIPDIFMLVMNVFCTAIACIALIKKDRYAYKWTVAQWITHTIFELQFDIRGFITKMPSTYYIPLGTLVSLIIGVLICRYYNKRKHLLKDDIYRGLIAIPEVVSIIYYVSSSLLGIYVYLYSVLHMFRSGILYGLFGTLLPGIGQLVYLNGEGWTSPYAYLCYSIFLIATGAKILLGATDTERRD